MCGDILPKADIHLPKNVPIWYASSENEKEAMCAEQKDAAGNEDTQVPGNQDDKQRQRWF